jgi:hypothetical protein
MSVLLSDFLSPEQVLYYFLLLSLLLSRKASRQGGRSSAVGSLPASTRSSGYIESKNVIIEGDFGYPS